MAYICAVSAVAPPEAVQQKERAVTENINVIWEYNFLPSLKTFSRVQQQTKWNKKLKGQQKYLSKFFKKNDLSNISQYQDFFFVLENITGYGYDKWTMMPLFRNEGYIIVFRKFKMACHFTEVR